MFQKLKSLSINLKNIFLCKKSRLLGKLDYPYCILPKVSYIVKMDFDELVDNQSIYVLRRSDLSEEETFYKLINGDFLLNDDAIENRRVPNLSINLMGGLFTNKHSKFVPLSDAQNRWEGGSVYLYKYINDYKIESGKGLIFINVNGLHNKQIPYTLPSDKNLHKEVANFQKAFGSSSSIVKNNPPERIELLGKIYFVHDPINLNYWHVELKIENYKEEIIQKASNVSSKEFVEELFTNWIKINSSPSIENCRPIESRFYCA